MKSRTHLAVAGILIGVTSALACSGADADRKNSDAIGTVAMELQLAPGVTVNSVSWSISNAGTGFSRAGTVNVQFSNTVKFQVGGLPSGDGFHLSITATSVDGTISCAGSADFSVAAGVTTPVTVNLICQAAPGTAGTIVVTGTTQVCATITSLSVSPLESTVDGPISLAATATAGSVTPTFAWTASAGTFDNAASATPTFTCPSTPQTVTITVSVAPGGEGCPTTTSQSIAALCDTLNPTFTNVYANVISQRCTGCHHPGGSGVTVGKLDMSTAAVAYASLVGVAAMGTGGGSSGVVCSTLTPAALRIAAGDSASSLLYEKVATKLAGTQPRCGSPMPPGTGAPLRLGQAELIKAWIDAGALNN